MEDWEQRVVDEKSELSKKIIALTTFVTTNPTFLSLDSGDRDLMWEQLSLMLNYCNVLERRIGSFSSKYFTKAH